jgi:hypothetical protein
LKKQSHPFRDDGGKRFLAAPGKPAILANRAEAKFNLAAE